MDKSGRNTGPRRIRRYQIVLAFVWAAVLVLCFLNRDRFTVDGVLAYTPQNTILAALFMMFLFALKSLSVFMFSGILFAANGILFPLPQAIALNSLGAGIMVSLPYWLGRRLGGGDGPDCPQISQNGDPAEHADTARVHNFLLYADR